MTRRRRAELPRPPDWRGGVPSVAYRFDYDGRAIVIAGHERKHPNARTLATGADILVHESAVAAMI